VIYWEFVDWSAAFTFLVWTGVLLIHLRSAGLGGKALREATALNRMQAEHIKKLHSLMKSAVYIGAMIRGGRPIVTTAPDGMTLEEAQSLIDGIFLTVRDKGDRELVN
jgi:hypothetical protein